MPEPDSPSRSEARLRPVCAILNGLMVNAKEGGSANDYTRAIGYFQRAVARAEMRGQLDEALDDAALTMRD